jgi:hypothetical protein
MFFYYSRFTFPVVLLVWVAAWIGSARSAEPPAASNQAFPPEIAAWTEADYAAQRDAAVRLNKDLQAAVSRGDKAFTIAPGNYRFHPDSLPSLQLRGAHDLTIEAAGATFWLYPFQRTDGILLDKCRNVTLRGLTVDYYPATYPQGDVVAINPEVGYIDFQLAPGFSTPMDVPGHLADAKLEHFDQEGHFLETRLDWVREVQDLGQGRYRVFPKGGWAYKYKTKVVPGTVLALAGRTMRMAFNLQNSDHCTLEDITIYASPHMALTESFGEGGHIYRRCKVIRRPDTRRFLACNADVFHSVGMNHGATIEGCEFCYSGDDLINIQGLLSLVYDQPAPDQIDILSQIAPDLPAGTELGFFDFDSLQPKGNAKVVTTTLINDPAQSASAEKMIADKTLAFLKPARLVHVQLDRAVTAGKYNLVTADARASQGAVIRGNSLHDSQSRAILVKSVGSLIEGNHIDNVGLGSIAISNDIHFMEGPFSSHVTIQNNIITRNGFNSLLSRTDWTYFIGAISITAERSKGLSDYPANFDIRVLNNRIEDSTECGIFMSNVQGGEIVNNTIIDAACREPLGLGRRMGLDNPAYGLVLDSCRDIDVRNNQFEKPGVYSRGDIAFFGAETNVGPQAPSATR